MDEKKILKIIEEAARSGSKALNLARKGIESLPAEIGKLKNLTGLNLHGNKLKSMPKELGQLKNLTSIWLGGNKLTSVPMKLEQLTNLRGLYLHNNHITELPVWVGNLSNLETLTLNGNQIKVLPVEITKLSKLKRFNFGNDNGLDELDAEIIKLSNLKLRQLEIPNSKITQLPIKIGKLTSLKTLELRNNKLTSVPKELGHLKNLTSLHLSDNGLTSLPPELGQLTNLETLDLDDNPLESPPPEVVKQGTKAILAYLRALAEKERQIWVSKLLFVGEGGVGKTSLLKRLLREEFDPDEETTHGLQIRTLEEPHPEEANVTMNLNAWDFGGQYVLHATHQFFLTGRSLFILVWNARHGWQQGKIYYWLDIIKAQAPESPVLIVATHTEDWPADLPYEEIQNRYPKVSGRFSVSCERRTGIEELEEAIRQKAAELPLMGMSRPASWLDVAEEVQELATQKNYIYPNEFERIMIQRRIKKEDRGSIAKWLHDLGYVLYFTENPELSNIVILNAEWVASNISKMLEDAEIETGLGIFKKEHVEEVWPEIEPPIRGVFLRLMEQFDLSFRTLEDKDISIVVERLSLDPSASAKDYEELWNSRESENEIAMKFYLNTSLPPGIPTWFIARSHRFTTYKHWRYGALFADREDKRHLSLVRAFDHERYVTLKTRGPAPHNFFALLRDGLELTLDRYPGLSIERKIPCPCHGKKGCQYEFDLKLVERALERGRETVECHESGDDVPVSQLLYGLDLRPDSAVITRLEVLSRKIEETSTITQKKVIGRVDSLEEEIIRDLGVILTELVELRELAQREFLSLFNRDQGLVESHCPNVFAVLPKDGQGWLKSLLGQKMVMQLYCQAPGQWHPAVEGVKGGRYEIKRPGEFLGNMGPYILKLAKVIKYAAPVAGAVAGMAVAGPGGGIIGAATAKKLAAQIKLMEELAKKLTDRDYLEAELLEKSRGTGIEIVEKSELGPLRRLLNKLDPNYEWGGLKKVLTPEGHYLWLCAEHAEEYKK